MSGLVRVRVDRNEELDFFFNMVASNTRERVMLVHADGGMGKSELLREFSLHCPTGVKFAMLDFKDGSIPDLPDLLSRLGMHIGWQHLTTLATHISKFTLPLTNISDNTTYFGRTEINVALAAPDEETRKFLRAAMTDALVADLNKAGAIILIFDTFNHCTKELSIWFSGFLARSCKTSNLTIVVAGRDVPEPTLEWETHCRLIHLEPIAPEYWHSYAHAIGATTVTLDFVKGCCVALKGHCLSIATTLDAQGGRHS